MVAASIVAGGKKDRRTVNSCRTLLAVKFYLNSLPDKLTRTNQGVNAITFQSWRYRNAFLNEQESQLMSPCFRTILPEKRKLMGLSCWKSVSRAILLASPWALPVVAQNVRVEIGKHVTAIPKVCESVTPASIPTSDGDPIDVTALVQEATC